MWGGDTRRIAEEAKRMAEQVGGLTAQHIADCSRRAETLSRDLATRDHENRADLNEWRRILGGRLDAQDRLIKLVAGMVITGLCGIVVTLATTLYHYATLK